MSTDLPPTRPRLSDLHIRVLKEIRQRRLLKAGQRIVIAVSGGQDSLCLLKILMDLASRWQWQLFVVHCDHRWTPDETACAQFLQGWFDELGLISVVETASVTTLDENRARQWRYGVLADWADRWQCSAVVTGHTGSDRAETLLLNLLRGTGPAGLASLDWQRPLDQSRQTSPDLVRPLLNVWRSETGCFCQAYQLPVWADLTNQDLTHARNRVRQELIPYLKTHFNPQVEEALNRTAAILLAEHEWVEQQAYAVWDQVYHPDPPRLDRQHLRQHPLAIQRQVIHTVLSQWLLKMPRFDQVEQVQQLLNAPRRSRTPPFPGGGWVEVEEHWLMLRNFGMNPDSAESEPSKRAYDSPIDLA